MEVHRELGNGFLEAVYHEALQIEFRLREIPFESHRRLTIKYKNTVLLKEYEVDIICHDSILLELKATLSLTARDEAQVLNYLKASGIHVGLLLNFGTASLQWKRLVF